MLAGRAGSGLDPDLVDVFLSLGDQLFDGLDAPSSWDLALLTEPGPQPVVTLERLDACLSAVADFADLKSMWTIGHSRGVARLAAADCYQGMREPRAFRPALSATAAADELRGDASGSLWGVLPIAAVAPRLVKSALIGSAGGG
jgi:hypothetical protein